MAKGFIVLSVTAFCLYSLAAYGDDLSRFEISIAYSFMHASNNVDSAVISPYNSSPFKVIVVVYNYLTFLLAKILAVET
jgi:hypothetical protein